MSVNPRETERRKPVERRRASDKSASTINVGKIETAMRPWHFFATLAIFLVGTGFGFGGWAWSVGNTLKDHGAKIDDVRARAEFHDGEDEKVHRNIVKIGQKLGITDLETPATYDSKKR